MLLQRGEVVGYDFNRMVVDFTMFNQGKTVRCAISTRPWTIFTLRSAGLLSRLKRRLSRGSSLSGTRQPLVRHQINRQLSGASSSPDDSRLRGALPTADIDRRS
jgi:hypothetical protein